MPDAIATSAGNTNYGKYLLVRKLAAGGMGEIFLAKQQGPAGFEKLLVVKKILAHLTQNREFVELFLGEARLAARMSHRNIVQLFELGEQDGSYFIAMEYVHGKTLRELIDTSRRKGERLHPEVCRSIAEQICDGASYAHNLTDDSGRQLNIIHRDLNPQNVLISYAGDVKIIDFGIAKSEMSTVKTEAGMIKGKFVYMSPEQSLAKKLDKRSDIFSIGIALYEMLTGTNPFHKANIVETLEAVQKLNPPPPGDFDPSYAPFDPLIARALAKDRDARYPDAADMQDELRRLVLPRAPERVGGFMNRLFRSAVEEPARSPGRPAEPERRSIGDEQKEHAAAAASARRTPPGATPVPEIRAAKPPGDTGGTLVLAPAARPAPRKPAKGNDTLLDASPPATPRPPPANPVTGNVRAGDTTPLAVPKPAAPAPAGEAKTVMLGESARPADAKTVMLGPGAPARPAKRADSTPPRRKPANGERGTSILTPDEAAAAQRSAMQQSLDLSQQPVRPKARPRKGGSKRSLWFVAAGGALVAVAGLVLLVFWLAGEDAPAHRARHAPSPPALQAEAVRPSPVTVASEAPRPPEEPVVRARETPAPREDVLSQGKLYGTLTVNPQNAPVTFAGSRMPKQVGAYNLPVTGDSGVLEVGDSSTAYAVRIDYRRSGSSLNLKVSTTPSAEIVLNGSSRGGSPARNVPLESEQSLLEVKKPGHPSMLLRLQFRPTH
jgi:eukaryotic-like serine/threonine-protein kinase